MGSSSRSRREKDGRRKSRSRSKERESRHESRKRSHRRRDEESSDDSDTSPVKISKRDTIKREADDQPAAGGSRQEELSIEETNKLRISLGLKPLEVDGSKTAPGDVNPDGTIAPMKTEEVFIKTENISDKLEAEKIREKVQTLKEKRQLQEKLKSIKPLGHESSDEEADDPISWIQKSRELEKRRAEEKAKQLQEMDEEIQRQNEEKEMIKKQNLYKERDLKGLTVGHSLDNIKEGTQVILTLRDKELLEDGDDEGDVLENVNIIDQEKAAENVLNKKLGKNNYNPYDDDEDKGLLSKYDSEIDGKKKETFKLGHNFEEEASEKLRKAQEEAKLAGKILVNLDDLPSAGSSLALKFATEYYTEEEMKKFKKPKRIKKKGFSIRKRVEEEEISSSTVPSTSKASDPDLASRGKQKEVASHDTTEEMDTEQPSSQEKVAPKISLMDIDEEVDNDVDVSNVLIEDDGAEDELQAALEKARKSREKKSKTAPIDQIAAMIAAKRESSMDIDEAGTSGTGLGLNSLAEFCRNVGESSQIKVEYDSDMNDSDEEEEIVIKKPKERSDLKPLIRSSDVNPVVKVDTKKERKGKWTEVNDNDDQESSDEERSSQSKETIKATPILGEEPDLTIGVGAALKLAMNKGYIERESGKRSGAFPKNSSKLSAVNYLIDEKFGGGDDRRSGRDRYSGRVSEFQEKANYKPEVNLEYIDDDGRILNEKEAFRQLSHKFHGKGPGKNKIDKRQQKLLQESKLRQMSSIDTPLNTVKKLQEKQKELQSAYVVISGSEAALIKKK